MPASEATLTAVILCGGRGSRMGGVDKGLVQVAGKPLIEHVLARVEPQVDHVIINANRSISAYESYRYPVVSDASGRFDGPLAGVAAGLAASGDEWLMTVPCDAPRVPLDLAQRLMSRVQETGSEICCVDDGDRLQPVFCVYHSGVLDALTGYLQEGERKIDRFFQRCKFTTLLDVDGAKGYLNLNDPQDVSDFELDQDS